MVRLKWWWWLLLHAFFNFIPKAYVIFLQVALFFFLIHGLFANLIDNTVNAWQVLVNPALNSIKRFHIINAVVAFLFMRRLLVLSPIRRFIVYCHFCLCAIQGYWLLYISYSTDLLSQFSTQGVHLTYLKPLAQAFSTCVPRNTGVPREAIRCSASNHQDNT